MMTDFGGPEKALWANVFIAAVNQGETHHAARDIADFAVDAFRMKFRTSPPFPPSYPNGGSK